jgi:hypothetical protein
MRKWGVLISVFYAVILLLLIMPGAIFLMAEEFTKWPRLMEVARDQYSDWLFWIPLAVIIASQALLLFLSVDTSQRRLKPRTHVLISCLIAGGLTGALLLAAIGSVGVGIWGDKFLKFTDKMSDTQSVLSIYAFWGLLWLAWAIFFYFYLRNSSAIVTRIASWLLRGSVLELLIAVPCHIIVRRRHDCSAPIVTGYGIGAGIAIMLLAFGPSVLFLYKKRLDAYSNRGSASANS